MATRTFPFGKASLGVGASMAAGAPVALWAAWTFDDALWIDLVVYGVGMTATLVLAVTAFVVSRRRVAANPWGAPVLGPRGPTAPLSGGGERTAATAGVALAGAGCGVMALVVLGLLVLTAVAVVLLFLVAQTLFGTR